MALLKVDEHADISECIAEVERHTDAELVAVLASKSDDYHYIPTLWAAVIALALPFVLGLSNYWLETQQIAITQVALFVAIASIFRFPPLLVRLIPKNVRYWRASNLARRQFLVSHVTARAGA